MLCGSCSAGARRRLLELAVVFWYVVVVVVVVVVAVVTADSRYSSGQRRTAPSDDGADGCEGFFIHHGPGRFHNFNTTCC